MVLGKHICIFYLKLCRFGALFSWKIFYTCKITKAIFRACVLTVQREVQLIVDPDFCAAQTAAVEQPSCSAAVQQLCLQQEVRCTSAHLG